MEECESIVEGSPAAAAAAAATYSADSAHLNILPSRSMSQGQGKGKGMLRELSMRQKTTIVNNSLKFQSDRQDQDVANRTWDLLIVDDSPLNRKMLMKLMCANHHTCVEAKDGQEALDAVQKRINNKEMKPYDAILMDFVMYVFSPLVYVTCIHSNSTNAKN